MKSALFVVAQQTFRDEEYARPKAVLEAGGIRVITASRQAGPCIGKLGLEIDAQIALADADAIDFDAVVFVGGAGAAEFFDEPLAHAIACDVHRAGHVTAAICIAPSILARAGLLDGVEATAFASQEEDLVEHGALWTGVDVQVSGDIVTANGPDAATLFGHALLSLINRPDGGDRT